MSKDSVICTSHEKRADVALVALGLARSRAQAKQLIDAGHIQVVSPDGSPLRIKPSSRIEPGCQLSLLQPDVNDYVSRAGLKLAQALRQFDVTADGKICFDGGQSTGGFTDCLLQHGASAVVGVDVGHAQLDHGLRHDHRVWCVEKSNLRHLSVDQLVEAISALGHTERDNDQQVSAQAREGFELLVADLSFISLRKVLPTLWAFMAAQADLLALVKPQFELGPGAVDRRGVVRDALAREGLHAEFERDTAAMGFTLIDWIPSPIQGGDGNTEYLMHLRRHPS